MNEDMAMRAGIAPWLSVTDATSAVDFYQRAFDAVERYRLADDETGRVMVAELAIDEATFWVQDDPDAKPADGGGPVRMVITVADPDPLFARALAAGGTQVAPIHEGHGWRIGRFVDPYGYHWEVGRRLPS